eukprot:6281498-Prymnesium_polylepis.1
MLGLNGQPVNKPMHDGWRSEPRHEMDVPPLFGLDALVRNMGDGDIELHEEDVGEPKALAAGEITAAAEARGGWHSTDWGEDYLPEVSGESLGLNGKVVGSPMHHGWTGAHSLDEHPVFYAGEPEAQEFGSPLGTNAADGSVAAVPGDWPGAQEDAERWLVASEFGSSSTESNRQPLPALISQDSGLPADSSTSLTQSAARRDAGARASGDSGLLPKLPGSEEQTENWLVDMIDRHAGVSSIGQQPRSPTGTAEVDTAEVEALVAANVGASATLDEELSGSFSSFDAKRVFPAVAKPSLPLKMPDGEDVISALQPPLQRPYKSADFAARDAYSSNDVPTTGETLTPEGIDDLLQTMLTDGSNQDQSTLPSTDASFVWTSLSRPNVRVTARATDAPQETETASPDAFTSFPELFQQLGAQRGSLSFGSLLQ